MSRELDPNQRKALGRGLSALLPSRPATAVRAENGPAAPAALPKESFPEQFEEFQSIPLDQISPGDQQPRSTFDSDKLKELAESIKAHGVIQPITVYRENPERYRIVAGERRWSAARLAGLKEIPALVRSVDQHQRLELALIENLQREDLNPIEIASAFLRLADEHGLSHEQIAERTGKDRSTVTNFLRLLRLSPYVREELARGTITVGHARTLLNVDEEQQAELCDRIIAKQLSVRATEGLVKRLTTGPAPAHDAAQGQGTKVDPNVRAALDEMARALGTKVKLIQRSDGAGRLEIEYYSHDDLDRIYSVITKQ